MTTESVGQTALKQIPERGPERVINWQFGDQGSVTESADRKSSIYLLLAEPFESSSALPKGSRDRDIHDGSFRSDEPPPLQYYTIALLSFALNTPVRALFLSSMCVSLLRILAIHLPILAYPITSLFLPESYP